MTYHLSNRGNKELKSIRVYLGLSIRDCANLIGKVTTKIWCKWETEYYIPDDVLEKMESLIALRFEYYKKLKKLTLEQVLMDINNNPYDKDNDPIYFKVIDSTYYALIFELVSIKLLNGEPNV